jgi:DNA-binding CsgD family transcriptional regulator
MGSSSRRDTLLDLVYGAVADPSRWRDVLIGISDHLDAEGGMLAHVPAKGTGTPIMIYGRLSEEHGRLFQTHYAWNPWSLAMRDVPLGKAVIVNSLLEPGAIFKTDFYADVLRPQRHVDIMNVGHAAVSQNGAIGGFGFSLSARGAEKAHHNVRRLQRLAPHLSRALDASLQFGRLADGARQLERVLQMMPNPALLLDGKGYITHANPAAEALLQSRDGLSFALDGGLQLTAALPAETAALSKALAQALAVASGAGDRLCEPMLLSRPSGAAPLLVMPVPLPPPTFAFWDLLERPRVLVLIVDPGAPSRAAAGAIQAAFGLTAAEARVAVMVAGGLTGPQAAAKLGLSPETVKTHLKRCFDKTGVHSQVALARLLGALPAASTNGGGGIDDVQ